MLRKIGSCKYLVEIPTAGPSADTLKLTALPSRAASCDRFAARLRLGQPDAFGAGASRDSAMRRAFVCRAKRRWPDFPLNALKSRKIRPLLPF